jgi:phage repressor protein C with HTH and peptisase S24 domain
MLAESTLTHERLWAALDTLAARAGLSPSALALRAGLDATAFNKSKRFAEGGRPRWPSTESIAKALAATGVSFREFAEIAEERREER